MKDIQVKKRRWVIIVAFIFFAVMGVLTFFSATIMNRGLPEVAAQYTQSGTITARIRGQGTVTANENFEVKVSQTRLVSEVRVRLGDEVLVGDVLIVLAGDVSEELEEAEEALRQAELVLERELLEISRPDGKIASASREVQRARSALTEAQQEQGRIPYSEAAINQAQGALNQARDALRQAEDALRPTQAALVQPQLALDSAQTALSIREDAVLTAREHLSEILIGGVEDQASINQARQTLSDAEAARDIALDAFTAALDAFNIVNGTFLSAQLAVDNANTTVENRQADLSTQHGYRDAWVAAGTAVRLAQQTLEDLIHSLSDTQTGANIDASLETIKLRELRRDVDVKREALEALQRDGTVSEITALVAGKVTAVNTSPGNQAVADDVLMVIEVVDRGYTLNLSVTAAQAARVNIGDRAEVDTFWWGSGEETSAVLTAIRNDPQPPGTNRILIFAVSGDVSGGDQLSLTLAQRSENYNIIVPNAAIRSDTNGDFVLVVVSRSTPLRTRYIATRADITILASDDTHTAVSGALTGWDFVITASNRPIEPGMQVRFVDNP